jgi:hypothetical protein
VVATSALSAESEKVVFEKTFRNGERFVINAARESMRAKFKFVETVQTENGETQEIEHPQPDHEATQTTYTLQLHDQSGRVEQIAQKTFKGLDIGVGSGTGEETGHKELRAYDVYYDGNDVVLALVELNNAFIETWERTPESAWEPKTKTRLGPMTKQPETFRFAADPNGQVDPSRIQLDSKTIAWPDIEPESSENDSTAQAAAPAETQDSAIENSATATLRNRPEETSKPVQTQEEEPHTPGDNQATATDADGGSGRYWLIGAVIAISGALLVLIAKFARN